MCIRRPANAEKHQALADKSVNKSDAQGCEGCLRLRATHNLNPEEKRLSHHGRFRDLSLDCAQLELELEIKYKFKW